LKSINITDNINRKKQPNTWWFQRCQKKYWQNPKSTYKNSQATVNTRESSCPIKGMYKKKKKPIANIMPKYQDIKDKSI
jgi:hypothetical protein